MKIALLCIGDELLKGSTVNTNLAFIGDRLLANGIIPELSLEIPDRRDDILRALNYTFSRADTVITSGGLGSAPPLRSIGRVRRKSPKVRKSFRTVSAPLPASIWNRTANPFFCCPGRRGNFSRCLNMPFFPG